MNQTALKLLKQLNIHPVLIDVGASGAPPSTLAPIASQSIYVGFDPDLRDIHQEKLGAYYQKTIINEAVVSIPINGKSNFYLTKAPHTSSTLKPDFSSISNYIYYENFIVERETQVNATTLNAALERLSLSRVDFLKLDTQGTDLRIYNSLSETVRSRLLVIDIEPPLIPSYQNEDLFVDVHKTLIAQGFWIADLHVGQVVRMNEATHQHIQTDDKKSDAQIIGMGLKKSPKWCRAVYFRSLSWLQQHNFDRQEYVTLWIFAYLENQIGFALDVAVQYQKVFGHDDIGQLLYSKALLQLKSQIKKPQIRQNLVSLLPKGVKSWLKAILNR